MKDARPLYLPLGMIMVVLSIIAYPSAAYFLNFASRIYLPYAFVFAILFPLLILAVSAWRTK